jgi:hypothetical protein
MAARSLLAARTGVASLVGAGLMLFLAATLPGRYLAAQVDSSRQGGLLRGLRFGIELRVTTPLYTQVEGRLHALTKDTLTLLPWESRRPALRSNRRPLPVPVDSILALDFRAGSRTVHGLLLGAGVGAALSIVGAVFVTADGEVTQAGAVTGIAARVLPISSLIGLLAGLDTPRWRPVSQGAGR